MKRFLKFVGWMLLLVIVGVVALIGYSWVSNKVAGPPPSSAALSDLRSLNTALHTYQKAYGHYPDTLAQLGVAKRGAASEEAAGLLGSKLAAGKMHGYVYAYAKTAGGYEIHGEPESSGTNVHLYTNETAEIRFARKRAASRDSAIVP